MKVPPPRRSSKGAKRRWQKEEEDEDHEGGVYPWAEVAAAAPRSPPSLPTVAQWVQYEAIAPAEELARHA